MSRMTKLLGLCTFLFGFSFAAVASGIDMQCYLACDKERIRLCVERGGGQACYTDGGYSYCDLECYVA